MTSITNITRIHLALVAAAALALTTTAAVAQDARFDVLTDPDFIEATAELSPTERYEAAAQASLELGEHAQAVVLLEAIVRGEADRYRGDLWHLLARAYNRLHEHDRARDAGAIALALDPDRDDYRLELGIAATMLDDNDHAIDQLTRYLALMLHDARAYYYRGLAHAQSGALAAARDDFELAVRANPMFLLPSDFQLALIDAAEDDIEMARFRMTQIVDALERAARPRIEQSWAQRHLHWLNTGDQQHHRSQRRQLDVVARLDATRLDRGSTVELDAAVAELAEDARVQFARDLERARALGLADPVLLQLTAILNETDEQTHSRRPPELAVHRDIEPDTSRAAAR